VVLWCQGSAGSVKTLFRKRIPVVSDGIVGDTLVSRLLSDLMAVSNSRSPFVLVANQEMQCRLNEHHREKLSYRS
jgi:hypothetical protein